MIGISLLYQALYEFVMCLMHYRKGVRAFRYGATLRRVAVA
jgi:hypothetical protein